VIRGEEKRELAREVFKEVMEHVGDHREKENRLRWWEEQCDALRRTEWQHWQGQGKGACLIGLYDQLDLQLRNCAVIHAVAMSRCRGTHELFSDCMWYAGVYNDSSSDNPLTRPSSPLLLLTCPPQ
jgi:hypothetical protein